MAGTLLGFKHEYLTTSKIKRIRKIPPLVIATPVNWITAGYLITWAKGPVNLK